MRTSLAAVVLACASAAAVVAYRSRPAGSVGDPLLPQVDRPPNSKAVMGQLLAGSPQRSIPTKIGAAEEREDASVLLAGSESQPDASGLTPQQKLECLLSSHDMLMRLPKNAPPKARACLELMFVSRCVATIMRERGLADYGDPVQLELAGGFSLRPSHPDEWVFAADRARYAFMRGDFPAYDMAKARCALAFSGEPVAAPPPKEQAMHDAIFQEALASLGVADIWTEQPSSHDIISTPSYSVELPIRRTIILGANAR